MSTQIKRPDTDLRDIETKIVEMCCMVCDILDLVERAFMEHKTEFLSSAMEKEYKVNDLEKEITSSILNLYKATKNKLVKKELSAFQQAVETLERMGDEAASLMERIEIKIAEHLLFSEEGVEQFNETYGSMKKSVALMREFLTSRDAGLKERVIDNGFHVKGLVERYRKEHSDRLLQGLCTEMGANMYFDMLDFTGNLARHSSNIVKLF